MSKIVLCQLRWIVGVSHIYASLDTSPTTVTVERLLDLKLLSLSL